jgi:uncharacterized integral membrane protein
LPYHVGDIYRQALILATIVVAINILNIDNPPIARSNAAITAEISLIVCVSLTAWEVATLGIYVYTLNRLTRLVDYSAFCPEHIVRLMLLFAAHDKE